MNKYFFFTVNVCENNINKNSFDLYCIQITEFDTFKKTILQKKIAEKWKKFATKKMTPPH